MKLEDAEGIPTPDPLLAGRSCGSSAGVAITLATFITNNWGRDQQGTIFSEAVLNKGFLILAHESTSWTKLSNHVFPQRVDHTLDLGCGRLRQWPTVTWLVPSGENGVTFQKGELSMLHSYGLVERN